MKKRILSILLLCCMVLTMLPTTVLAADGPMDTIPKYDVSIDVYNRTSDISIKDSRSYYIYSSVPDKLRDTWAWDKKIFIKGDKTAPHIGLVVQPPDLLQGQQYVPQFFYVVL